MAGRYARLVPLVLLTFALVPASVVLAGLWVSPAEAATLSAPRMSAPRMSAPSSPVPGAPAAALVTSASASPASLPASGGTVRVTGSVEHATSCRLEVLSSQSFPVVYSHAPRSCTAGTFSAEVVIGANRSLVARTVAFALVATNATSSYPGRFYVRLAPAPQALVTSASASPTSLPPSGGTVTVTGSVEHATSCRLEVLSSQSFPVVYSHAPRSCTSGYFSAQVTIGPNSGHSKRTVALALAARNQASSSTGRFYVALAGAALSASALPPATTTVPSTSAPVSLVVTDSSNWSGYSAVGGPYTEVKGTFTVPSVLSGAPSNAQVSQWVGLDGTTPRDPSLIQAGVDEYPDAQSPQGFDVQAWWEILPAAETNITMPVNAGDEVSVTIWKLSAGTWKINVTDDTTGASYTTPPESYNGPGASAEWIVEATTECQSRSSCHTSSLAPYSPPVAFSDLGMSGPQATSVNDIVLVQGFNDVATPSPLTNGGFNVPYTGPSTSPSGI